MTQKLTFAVLALVMLAACEKTDTAKSAASLANKTPDALIIAAQSFFNNDIVTTHSPFTSSRKDDFSRHKVNKTPLWDKAYITRDKTKGDC